jgi:two-component system nitrogen regulation response regulator NtrX
MYRILVIDDEENIRAVLSEILEDEGYEVETAADGLEGLKKAVSGDFSLVFLDVRLPGMGGLEVLKEIKKVNENLAVVIISGHGNIDMAVKALKVGAFDFLEKPLSLEKVITLAKNALALEDLKLENRELKEAVFQEDRMIGSGPEMDSVRKIIIQVAGTSASVMILGENGTGKELAAREIHKNSSRKDKPFVEVNCASIPDSLLESELFGHEKGAFTGAVASRKGKFELADGGTLFLDEIADMSLSAQAKVLRAVQEMRFERVGSEKSVSVDVRILAATNKDIIEEVQAGRFREDLFFRLNVIPIKLPPLRERKNDIKELVLYFFNKYDMPGSGERRVFSDEAMEKITSHYWSGNIRELKNFVQRISVMTEEELISGEMAEYYLEDSTHMKKKENSFKGDYSDVSFSKAKELFEKNFLIKKLEENGYNISRTAQDIGMYPGNLHNKIKKLGINLK